MTKRRSKAAPGGQSPSRSRRRFRPAACAVPDARPRGPLARCGRALAALGLLAVALKAQPPSQGGDPQDPGARPRQPSLLGPGPEEIMRDYTPPGFRGVDRNLPIFQGFPTVVPPTFGHYPGGALPVPFGGTELPPVPLAAPPSPNAWPSWFTGPEDDDPEGFTKDVAILVQTTDYVWLRPAGEAVFVPLIFYDRYRVVRAGSEIEVRGGGQFLLTFQEGAQLRVQGPARLSVRTLGEESIDLGFTGVRWATLNAGPRPVRLSFGRSFVSEFVATRAWFGEWHDGIVELHHSGPGAARLAIGDPPVPFPALHRVLLMPEAAGFPVAPPRLELEGGVQAERDGRVLRVAGGGEGGAVDWMGARFRVPGGAAVRLDALSGEDFPDYVDRDR